MALYFLLMRYHYTKPKEYSNMTGYTYSCDHPLYNKCTLYFINGRGLAVVQQRFNSAHKVSWWGEIDPWLIDDIFNTPGFKEYFDRVATEPSERLFPTVSVRQIMWALKMKPIKRERWETVFDRRII